MSDLFNRVVDVSGLSPLFARNALQRACARAGVHSDGLTRGDLRTALPEIERTIRTYLHEQTPGVMTRLQELARGG
jgi:hypothetical protein